MLTRVCVALGSVYRNHELFIHWMKFCVVTRASQENDLTYFVKLPTAVMPEEVIDFKFTADYLVELPAEEKATATKTSSITSPATKDEEIETIGEATVDLMDTDTSDDESTTQSLRAKLAMSRILSGPTIMERTVTMAEVEQAYSAALEMENIPEQASHRIKPRVD
ncbi:uncharacterized protein RSE6_06619 [Rhynchosporium secalis]|uniref:Uncharacterized protein n=1 Tax=Rhynchosporium secalis TaxID=38038 RepID=A0A1E1MAZ6_RHYSE|nr:uncharacterized protein RSE6_06619 [Rhynchosporium secalis]